MLLTIVRLNESEWVTTAARIEWIWVVGISRRLLLYFEPNDLMSSPDDHSSMQLEHMASRATQITKTKTSRYGFYVFEYLISLKTIHTFQMHC